MQEFIADSLGPITMPRGKEPQRRRTSMKHRGLWAACVVLILLVGAGVLTIGAGSAKDEDAAGAKCSEATLHGKYLYADHGFEIKGNTQVPIAEAGYQMFNGNGKVKGVASGNFNGEVFHNEHFSGTYAVKADCTGTFTFPNGWRIDVFIAPDGSMFTAVQTNPPEFVRSGFDLRGTAQRVGD
jgi:hypothetical protein